MLLLFVKDNGWLLRHTQGDAALSSLRSSPSYNKGYAKSNFLSIAHFGEKAKLDLLALDGESLTLRKPIGFLASQL